MDETAAESLDQTIWSNGLTLARSISQSTTEAFDALIEATNVVRSRRPLSRVAAREHETLRLTLETLKKKHREEQLVWKQQLLIRKLIEKNTINEEDKSIGYAIGYPKGLIFAYRTIINHLKEISDLANDTSRELIRIMEARTRQMTEGTITSSIDDDYKRRENQLRTEYELKKAVTSTLMGVSQLIAKEIETTDTEVV